MSDNGGNFIPASQRPDGTWRKPRRVKEGYVPQEEVPLYESKGKQFMNRQSQPSETFVTTTGATLIAHPTIPGLFIEEKPKKPKKQPKPVQDTKPNPKPNIQQIEVIQQKLHETKLTTITTPIEPAKRLKNLRKRLREIEALELKIESGELKNPEKEQLDKIERKEEVMKEIRSLE